MRPQFFCSHDGIRFVRCGECATIYHGSPPDWARISRVYEAEYHQARGHGVDPWIDRAKEASTLPFLRLLQRLDPPGRRLLEVGCSAGAALEAAVKSGWEVEGVELSETSAAIARARAGVRAVHTGRIEDAGLGVDYADVVTLFDVIEHIDPPRETLATIHRILKPRGLVLMVTPDAGSLSARLMRSRWPHLFIEHVVLFSREGMGKALAAAGFRVEKVGFAWKRVNLNMLVRHATIHRDVSGGALLRVLGRVLPQFLTRPLVPFNIGEFYAIARRVE